MSEEVLDTPIGSRNRALLLTGLAMAVAAAGLLWAKWLPYTERVGGLVSSRTWPGSSLLTVGAGVDPVSRARSFTWSYSQAVWKALLVALVISACVDVLVPRRWLLRMLGGRTPLRGSLVGGLVSLPGMMCTCCTAPLTVTLRRIGVPVAPAMAFWLGNPVLNPAVLIFLALLAPASWVAVRVTVGVVLVVGVSALFGHLVTGRDNRIELPAHAERALHTVAADAAAQGTWRELPERWARSFGRLAIVLVPEYLLVVFVVGLVGEPLARVLGNEGVSAMVIAAVVGTILVVPTGGEIPILLGLAAAGASAGVLGALLVALPALSLPSMIMVGRSLGWRVTVGAGVATVLLAAAAGAALTMIG